MSSKASKTKKKSAKTNSSVSVQQDKYISYEPTEVDSPLRHQYEKDLIYYHIFVNDFPKMRNFYNEVLVFDLSGQAPEQFGFCEFYLPVQGARLGMSKTNNKLLNRDAAPSLNIPAKDLDATYTILKEKGIEVSEIQDIPKMISMFDFRDPEENTISIIGKPRL